LNFRGGAGAITSTIRALGGRRNARMVLVIAPAPPRKFNVLAQK